MGDLVNRLRTGQTFHCPECGFGFPVQDPTAADEIERLTAELASTEVLDKELHELLERHVAVAERLQAKVEQLERALEHVSACHNERLRIAKLTCEVCEDITRAAIKGDT